MKTMLLENVQAPPPAPPLPRATNPMHLLQDQGERVALCKGESIALPADGERPVCFVIEGSLRLMAERPGTPRPTLVEIVGPGELFGSLPLAGGDGGPNRAVAMEAAVLLRVPAREIEALMDRAPATAIWIAGALAARMRRLESRLSQVLFKDARQRVAFALLDLAEQWGVRHGGGGTLLDVHITHQDVASMTGLTRETVSLTLGEFDLAEMIRTIGRRIIILDGAGLRRVMETARAA